MKRVERLKRERKIRRIKLTITSFVLIALTIIVGANINKTELLQNNKILDNKAYNHAPDNILENVFIKDDLTILPFIFENSDQTISKQYIIEQFKEVGRTIENLDELDDIIVTGDEIKTKNKTYTVLIYGDANGDGYVNGFDSQTIVRHDIIGGKYTLSGIYALAGDVKNDDGVLDSFDGQVIVRFDVGFITKYVINEPETAGEPYVKEIKVKTMPDKVKYTYGDTIDITGATIDITISTGEKVEPIVVTNDMLSTTIANEVGTQKVTITYEGKTCTFNIEVEDYIEAISMNTLPNKVEYKYGEEINVAGATLDLKMASGQKVDPVEVTLDMLSATTATEVDSTKIKTITVTYEGHTCTFDIEVDDYVVAIELASEPTNKSYKYDDTINVTGATINVTLESGKVIEGLEVTLDMLSTKVANEVGTNVEIKVTYAKQEASFTIEVIDWIKSIAINTMPNKTSFNYEKTIDITGATIDVIMASGVIQDTIEVTNSMLSTTTATDIGKQEITITYAEKTCTLVIDVINYITGIEIVKSPTKTDYVAGEEILLDDIKVVAIKANGDKNEEINVTLDNENRIAKFNTAENSINNKVTVQYSTNVTENETLEVFTDEFDVTVVKPITNVNVTKLQLPTQTYINYCYDNIDIMELESGENEVKLTKQIVENSVKDWIITKDGSRISNNLVTVTVTEDANVNGKVKVSILVKTAGTYEITPKINNVTGNNTIDNLKIKDNKKVTNMELQTNIDVKYGGNEVILPITFKHYYEDSNIPKIEVRADQINISGEGLECHLLQTENSEVDGTANNVNFIKIKAVKDVEETETTTLEIKFRETENDTEYYKTFTRRVTIAPEANLVIEKSKKIELYAEERSNYNEEVTKFIDTQDNNKEYIVTLVEAKLDDTESILTFEKADRITINSDKVGIIPYKSDKTMAENSYDVVKYIGIAAAGEDELYSIPNNEIEISYKGKFIKTITVDPIKKELHNLNVTELISPTESQINYCYDTIDIMTLESGKYEIDLTEEMVENSIKDWVITKNGTPISNSLATFTITEDEEVTGKIKVSMLVKTSGTYTITPKINGVTGSKPINNLVIKDNKKVTNMELQTNINVKYGRNEIILPVTFKHYYDEENIPEIEVMANLINISGEGLECHLLKTETSVVDGTGNVVNFISIKATKDVEETEITTLEIKFRETDQDTEYYKTFTRKVTIEPEANLVVAKDTTIKLYAEEQASYAEEVVKYVDGTILTLVGIGFDDTQSKFTYEKADDLRIEPSDNVGAMYYKVDKVTEAGPNDVVAYLGIAAYGEEELYSIPNNEIKIYYKDKLIKTITVEPVPAQN